MPTPLTQQFRDAKREAILVASTKAFAEHGFAATTVAVIARSVGVGKASVYDAFGSKEDLLLACCLRVCEQDNAEILAAGSRLWSGFPAMVEAVSAGRDAEVSGLADPLGFSHELLCTHLRGQLRRAGAESRLFLDLFMASSHDPTALARVRAAIHAMFSGWEELTATLLRMANRAGQIPPCIDPAAHARLLILALDGFMLQQFWGRFPDAVAEGDRVVATWFSSLNPAS